ncbi:MAG: cupin domain-containing protein [Halobacteriales archaeon]|nr:cupin domain-containing protein [Halobacteriales archaeon]
MAYHVIDPDDIEPMNDRPVEARSISDALALENMGLRVYRAEPGQQLPLAYHYHEHQEEAFYVIDGTLYVETPEGEYQVEAGEVFVAEPTNPHRAHNPEDADGTVVVLAAGAPAVSDAEAYSEE